MSIKLSELASLTGCTLQGEDCLIDSVADINHAKAGQLAFLYNPKFLEALKITGASAVVLKEEWLSLWDGPAMVSANPRLAFAKAATALNPVQVSEPGVASSTVIDETVTVPTSVSIGHHTVIEADVRLGDKVQIGAGCVISSGSIIGDNTVIHPNVSIGKGTQIGSHCTLFSGVVIGADGFGYVPEGQAYFKVPQTGNVVIGNQVDVGANTTIDRGALLDTVIHDGVKLDNLIQVGHNVEIGQNTVISAYTAIAGSVKIGKNCLIGGGVGIRDNIEIVDNVTITGRSFVSSSIKTSGSYSSSVLIDKTSNWKKNVMRFKKLDDLARRFLALEKKLEQQQAEKPE